MKPPKAIAARRCVAWFVMAWAMWVGACAKRVEEAPPHATRPPAPALPDKHAADLPAAGQVTLRAIEPAELADVVKKYQGNVVLVDFWATWCLNCKELFPHTVALHREFGSKGLAVVSVSFDDAEEEPAALEFLRASGATFENLRARTGASPQSPEAFGIQTGAIPHLRLYDRAGKLRKTFPAAPTAPIKPDEVDRAVKELLAEAAGT